MGVVHLSRPARAGVCYGVLKQLCVDFWAERALVLRLEWTGYPTRAVWA